MTISANVRKELFEMTSAEGKLIRIKPTEAKAGTTVYSSKQSQPLKMWTQEEHEKFLEAMEKYPSGPWKVIAAFIGTKTTRQTMTHAQKYRQKISRWRRGLRHKGRKHSPDSSGHGSGSGSDNEYLAKENLFKAIEHVSSDRVSQHPSNSDAGNQLFRLAELASIEVMKGNSPLDPANTSPQFEEVGGSTASRILPVKQEKSDWYGETPSKEWHKAEIKLSPLRSPDMVHQRPHQSEMNEIYQQYACDGYQPLTACSLQNHQVPVGMMRSGHFSDEDDARVHGNSYLLPPLKMSPNGSNLGGIPPLRSKIDPSVLGCAQYATTN